MDMEYTIGEEVHPRQCCTGSVGCFMYAVVLEIPPEQVGQVAGMLPNLSVIDMIELFCTSTFHSQAIQTVLEVIKEYDELLGEWNRYLASPVVQSKLIPGDCAGPLMYCHAFLCARLSTVARMSAMERHCRELTCARRQTTINPS